MGRPAIEITEEICNKARECAARGLTKKQIATCLGFSYDTLNDKSKEFIEFADAIKEGQASGIREIANALFENAMGGNTTAQIFYLKNRAPDEWKDRVPEASGGDAAVPSSVRVTIQDARAKPD